MYTLESERLKINMLFASDISEEYLATLNDSKYMRFSRNSAFAHTYSSQARYIEGFVQSNNLLFGLKNNEGGKLVGSINCYIDFSKMTLDLGFLIFRDHSGKGYISEALELLIPYLAGQFPGMTLVIGSNKENFAMHHIARKFDFQIEDNVPQDVNSNLRFVRRLLKLDSTSMPGIPDFVLSAKRIGVVAYDAGGAEQISWLLRNLPEQVMAYIDGPAKRVFDIAQIAFDCVDKLSDMSDCDLIITGSGWMSHLEIDAIREAKLQNIPCLTVLDHWVNYLERFGGDEKEQPQIIAVTNSVALQMAQEKFPDKIVWLLPDFQIYSYREAIKLVKDSPSCVLILLEPTSSSNSEFPINDEVIKMLIETAISIKRIEGLRRVLIRPHPSQIDDPSLAHTLNQFNGEIELSRAKSLIEDLKISKLVLGLSSYALYISSMCGIDTHSYFSGLEGHWTKRFPQITRLPFPL